LHLRILCNRKCLAFQKIEDISALHYLPTSVLYDCAQVSKHRYASGNEILTREIFDGIESGVALPMGEEDGYACLPEHMYTCGV
jgi:hypothetical protein